MTLPVDGLCASPFLVLGGTFLILGLCVSSVPCPALTLEAWVPSIIWPLGQHPPLSSQAASVCLIQTPLSLQKRTGAQGHITEEGQAASVLATPIGISQLCLC